METLKEHRNILLGHRIDVHTDHKNLVYKHFNTERVMRWRLLLEEFGPNLIYIKGGDNVVADALSRMRLTEADFSPEAFALDDEKGEFPESHSLTFADVLHEQKRCPALQEKLKNNTPKCAKTTHKHSDQSCELITWDNRIVIPPSMQRKATE